MKNTKDKIKPIAIFIFFIISLVFFVSAGSQFYFTQPRLQKILDQNLSEKIKIELKFQKAQISFSGSLSPMFAVKFSQLELKHSQCQRQYKLNAPYVLIPISLIQALQGRIQLGYVKTGHVEISSFQTNSVCSDGTTESIDFQKTVSKIRSEKKYDKIFNYFAGIFKMVKGFRILELTYTLNEVGKSRQYNSKNIKVSLIKKNKSIQIYNEIDFKPYSENVKPELSVQGINLKLQTIISKSEGLTILARARHLEGVFEIKSFPQKNLNDYNLELQISDLPLTFLSQVLGVKILSHINAHKVWHNSNAIVNLKNIFNAEIATITVDFNNLEFFGPVLKSFASDFKIQIKPNFKILNQINWRLENLDLNGLIPLELLSQAKGVVDQYGLLKGSGLIDENMKVTFEGLISDTSFLFSQNGKKSKQLLSDSNIVLDFEYPNLNFQLENISLKGGSFEGEIVGNVSLVDDINWNIKVKSDLFSLSDKVQKLYDLEQSAFEKLILETTGQNRELKTLSFSAEVENLKTKWGDFNNSSYKLNYNPDLKMYDFVLSSDEFILKTKYLKINIFDQSQSFKNFKTSLGLSSKNKSFSLTSESSGEPFIHLFASGDDYNKEFLANLKIDKSEFILEGHINSGFKIKSVK